MLYLIFVILAVSVIMFFFITRVAILNYNSGVNLDNGKVNISDSEVDWDGRVEIIPRLIEKSNRGGYPKSVDWINGGGSLPQPDPNPNPNPNEHNYDHPAGWSENNEGNHSESNQGYHYHHNEESGNNVYLPLPEGTPYKGHPNVVWNGKGQLIPAEGYTWGNLSKPGANNYWVVPLPLGTPYQGHPNVVWSGDGEHVEPAEGYKWENSDDFSTIQLTTKEKIEKILYSAKRASKDKGIRNWIVNVKWELSKRPTDKDFLSPWVGDSCLIFNERFLTETKATRENLVAFESGKLFFTIMKNKPVKDGNTLEIWWAKYSFWHSSMIAKMQYVKSKDQNEDLSMIRDFDKESQFGYIFRVQALQLDKPKDKKERQEWDKNLREFRTYIDPLLRGK